MDIKYFKKMSQENQGEYDLIPLSVAAEEANLTPEYLNFLSRNGKLKAEKIGRNWLTTRRWLKEFISGDRSGSSFKSAEDSQEEVQEKPYCDVLAVKIAMLEKEIEELKKEKDAARKEAEASGKNCPIMYILAMLGISAASIFISHFFCMHEESLYRSFSEKAAKNYELGKNDLQAGLDPHSLVMDRR